MLDIYYIYLACDERTNVRQTRTYPLCAKCLLLHTSPMLITKTHYDIPSTLDNGRPIRIYVISPNVPNYPQAKFPGKVMSIEACKQAQ